MAKFHEADLVYGRRLLAQGVMMALLLVGADASILMSPGVITTEASGRDGAQYALPLIRNYGMLYCTTSSSIWTTSRSNCTNSK